MIKNYFKTAWRSSWKNKATSLINITGLSVGMTAAVLIMLWVQNETSFDNIRDSKNIFRLTSQVPSTGWVWETTPLLLAPAIKSEVPEIEKTTRLYTNNWPVFNIKGAKFYEKNCAYVDNDWFNIFRYDFIAGNAHLFNEHPFSIILSDSAAKKYFGDKNAIGQTIRIDSVNYLVRGVVADAPVNSSFQYKAFIPISALLANPQLRENDEQWGNANYITFVKAIAGSNPAKIAEKITGVMKKRAGDDALPITMVSLKEMHFETEIDNSAFVHGNRNTVYVFSFLGFILLLIACINYVNLTTARASLRAREISIRKITGADRYQLFYQFITESVLISLISLIATLLLMRLCLPAFNELTGKAFTLPLTSPGLWQVLGITLFTALLLNSVYPALLLSSFKPLNVFRGKTILKVKDGFFRKGLVVLQFTISVILIAGTIIIYGQMQFIQKNDPGYNRSKVVSFVLPPSIGRLNKNGIMNAIKQDLLSENSVEMVGTSNQPVVNIGSYCSQCADWPGRDTNYNPKIAQLSADIDFQKTMQLKMVEGRWFENGTVAGKKDFILNETAVKDFNLGMPATGKRFIFKGDTGRVIGVVKDFYYKSMHDKMGPVVIFNNPAWRNQFVVRTAGNASVAVAGIEKAWKKYIPDSPLEYTFLDDSFNALYKQDRQGSFLILLFALIAILISALGLFSLAAFEAEQRTKEIGIRKVLGCTSAGIATLLSKDFLKLICIAIFIASPVAWWASGKWLQAFEYRIEIHWWMFAIAGFLAMMVALATISYQALKAAVANPVKSLRTE